MSRNAIVLLLISVLALAGAQVWAEEPADKTPAVEKVSIPTQTEPNEQRNYDVTVKMAGRMPGGDKQPPVDLNATYAMQIRHQYRPQGGRRPAAARDISYQSPSHGRRTEARAAGRGVPETDAAARQVLQDRQRIRPAGREVEQSGIGPQLRQPDRALLRAGRRSASRSRRELDKQGENAGREGQDRRRDDHQVHR